MFFSDLFSLFFYSVLADANFPSSSICACGPTEIRADGMLICMSANNNTETVAEIY